MKVKIRTKSKKVSESCDMNPMPNPADEIVLVQSDACADHVTLPEMMMQWSAYLQSLHMWFHSAHVSTKGQGFSGDHVDLFGLIYNASSEHLDEVMERGVGLTNDELVACPITIAARSLEILKLFPSPSGMSAENIAMIGLQCVMTYIEGLEELYEMLKKSGDLTLGLDDLIMSQCNEYEKFTYKLQQRIKMITPDDLCGCS